MEALSYCQLMERCLAAEARVVELVAENVGLKESRNNLAEFIHEELDADYPLNMNLETPATDHIVAAQRSTFVDEAVSKITESGALTFGDCIVALCQLRESAK